MSKYIASIDQGTTSTRFILFDHAGAIVAVEQREHNQSRKTHRIQVGRSLEL